MRRFERACSDRSITSYPGAFTPNFWTHVRCLVGIVLPVLLFLTGINESTGSRTASIIFIFLSLFMFLAHSIWTHARLATHTQVGNHRSLIMCSAGLIIMILIVLFILDLRGALKIPIMVCLVFPLFDRMRATFMLCFCGSDNWYEHYEGKPTPERQSLY
jgi:hypothetical protein